MKELTDTELIALIKQSDPGAFNELHLRFWHDLFKIANRKIGDPDETNDLLQEMFIELWEKREGLNFNNAVGNWLRNRLWFKIAGYFRLKGFNDKHLENFRSFLIHEEETALTTDGIELKEADHFYEEILAVINQSIDGMPDRMREIFNLSKTDNLSTKEIAAKLEISPKTVKVQLERAKLKLKKATAAYHPKSVEILFILWLINC